LPMVSMMLAANLPTSVNNAGGNLSMVSTTLEVNLPSVSVTLAVYGYIIIRLHTP
jgi:hypothetical protein